MSSIERLLLNKLVKYINTKNISNNDMETKVTRNGQVTIPKEIREKLGIREGIKVHMNVSGSVIMITKRDPEFWRKFKGGFLPKDFKEIRKSWRKNELERLKKLGVLK